MAVKIAHKAATKKTVAKAKPAAKTAPKPKPPAKHKAAAKRKPLVKRPPAAKPKPVAKAQPAPLLQKKLPPLRPLPVHTLSKEPRRKLSPAEMNVFMKKLRDVRDRVVDQISFLAGDNLKGTQRDVSGDLSSYSLHPADQGTDNFDREFALNLVSSEHDTIYEIDDAMRRISDKIFGICEACGHPIEKIRLEALPFTRVCITCKEQMEKNRPKYRPLSARPRATLLSEQEENT